MIDQRALFEAAVIARLKESGFLEIEIRTECLVRCDDGYQDEVINAGWHYWQAASAALPAPPDIDPALIGIAEEMKESGGHWMPCTGCHDTEDGYPTRKYAYSPALQTAIGCGCHECGGLGAVWWHMTDEELAEFVKDCADLDTIPAPSPQDVINLVIAAREFWDANNDLSDESRALDKALEAFAEHVPYENPPEGEGYSLTPSERLLLEWLAKEDSSALGECEGADLARLEQMGTVTITPAEGRHRHYSRVSVTEVGLKALASTPGTKGGDQ